MSNYIDLETLGVFANIFQVLNYAENLKQSNNDDIMQMLQKQNEFYLETIVKQNELILKLLGGVKDEQ